MVLFESVVPLVFVVVTDMGVRPRDGGSCVLDTSVRPRVSSKECLPSIEGRLGSGEGWEVGARTSTLSFVRSGDGRANKEAPLELDGRVGGDGGAWPPREW